MSWVHVPQDMVLVPQDMTMSWVHVLGPSTFTDAGVYVGPFRGEDSDRTLLPIQTHKKPGRPRIKRYRHKKQTKKTIMEKFPDVVAPEYAYMTNFV